VDIQIDAVLAFGFERRRDVDDGAADLCCFNPGGRVGDARRDPLHYSGIGLLLGLSPAGEIVRRR
jgi:hypothetical protein